MTGSERWLAAVWPLVRGLLPAPPAHVVEIGSGPLGGFVPMLRSDGYQAIGVDPEAPAGPAYRQVEFERAEAFADVDAVVASTSLHHVLDPEDVIGRVASVLAPAGRLVVLEWDWEAIDEPTARWCFERLESSDAGWLHRRRDEWLSSGQPWPVFIRRWASDHGLHPWVTLQGLLDERFEREHFAQGPYFFPDLGATTEEEERAGIDAGRIRATRVEYAGVLRGGR